MNFCDVFLKQFKRELLIQWRQPQFIIHSSLFLLIFLCMIPLAVNPHDYPLQSIIPGLIWLGILLSLLLTAEHLFYQDFEQGVVEQWVISSIPMPLLIHAKVSANCVCQLVPFLLLSPCAALFYDMSLETMFVLALTIICGTPTLLFLCALVSSFAIGLNQRGGIMAIILLPLSLPILIFGSKITSIAQSGLSVSGHLTLLCAISIVSSAFLPFAISGSLRLACTEY